MEFPISPDGQPAPIMDLTCALDRMGGDRDLLRDAVDFFLVDSKELLDRLAQALQTKNAKLAVRCAHSLSGLSANFGAEVCSTIADSIEDACETLDLDFGNSLMPALRTEISRLVEALKKEFGIETPPD